MTDQSIRVASYNTRDFLDDRRAAARVIRAIDPDVLCLQEVPRRLGAARRVRRFADECGLRWPGGHRGSGGTAIFHSDRVGIDQVWHRRLSVALLHRTRGYAMARITVPGTAPVLVTSVHLSLHAGERHVHTRQVLAAVAEHAGGAARTVVAGDLNELDTGSAWWLMTSRLTLASPLEPTFPARRPRALLDVIFTGPDLSVLPHRPVDLDPDDLLAASDHLPVWVDVLV